MIIYGWVIYTLIGFGHSLKVRFISDKLASELGKSSVALLFSTFIINIANMYTISRILLHAEHEFGAMYYRIKEDPSRLLAMLEYSSYVELHSSLFHIKKLLDNPELAENVLQFQYEGPLFLYSPRSFFLPPPLYFANEELQKTVLENAIIHHAHEMESLGWLEALISPLNNEMIEWLFCQLAVSVMVPEIMEIFARTEIGESLAIKYIQAVDPKNKLELLVRTINFSAAIGNTSHPLIKHPLFSPDGAHIMGILEVFEAQRSLPNRSSWGTHGSLLIRIYTLELMGKEEVVDRIAWFLQNAPSIDVVPFIMRRLVDIFSSLSPEERFYLHYLPATHLPLRFTPLLKRIWRWKREGPMEMWMQVSHQEDAEEALELVRQSMVFLNLPTNMYVRDVWIGDWMVGYLRGILRGISCPPLPWETIQNIFMAWPYLILKGEKLNFFILFANDNELTWSSFFTTLGEQAGPEADRLANGLGLSVYFTLSELRLLTDTSFEKEIPESELPCCPCCAPIEQSF